MNDLFEELKIGNVTLKNRLVVAPMGMGHAEDGGISDTQRLYLLERAKGGFGLIYPSAQTVSDRYEHPNTCGNHLVNPSHAKRLKRLVEQVHMYGAKVAIQLTPGYGRVNAGIPGKMTEHVSASENTVFSYPKEKCRSLTTDEIHQLVKDAATSAYYAKMAGVDIIEIHCYGGYLLDQFMTKCWNWREDEYGGSFENRMRFTDEIHDALRSVLGKEFPISIKLTPQHSFPGGRTLEDEGIKLVKYFAEQDYAYIHLDHGAYECWNKAIPSAYEKPGCQLFIAERLREEGVTIPFLVQGKLNDPELAIKVLKDKTADMIALGHQSIADPYWPRKVMQGRSDDIQYCICCNECLNTSGGMRSTECAINPLNTNEVEYKVEKPSRQRKILVVGAGPAGMYAAKMAAELGHDVTLWERKGKLGGLMRAAAEPDFKQDLHRYMEYIQTQVYKKGVKVVLNKDANEKSIKNFAADAIILACGAQPIFPKISGIKNKNVLTVYELLVEHKECGETVVVLGGGLAGCESAIYLAAQGKKVILVEMMDQILAGANMAANDKSGLLEKMKEYDIHVFEKTKVTEIKNGCVKACCEDKEICFSCDNVVVASGYKVDSSLETGLKKMGCTVFTIGDNVKPGKVLHAIHSAFHTIRLLDDLIENATYENGEIV